MAKLERISIVVPCYNEEEALPYFYEEIVKVARQMSANDFEFIFIDDGSKDNTLQVVKEFAEKDDRVKYISFSKNFGKESAIYAGFKSATGDYVAMMDADLQDPPALLPDMYNAIVNEGYDSVATRRVTRKGEPKIRSFFARQFYKIMNKVSDTELVDGTRDYRLMNRKFVDAILSMGERNRFTKGMFGWVGFKTKWIEFENVERVKGETKWSFFKLLKYAISGIMAFSNAPLKISTVCGIGFLIASILGFIACIICSICSVTVASSLWIILSLALFSGINLTCIGILGEYLAKINSEVKKRPIYITKESNIEE